MTGRERFNEAVAQLERKHTADALASARSSRYRIMPPIGRDLYPDLRPVHGPLSRSLRKLLPQPTRSEGDYRRYHHLDLPALTVRQITHERFRIITAIGQTIDSLGIPPWFDARLEKLQNTSMKGRKR